MRRYVLLVALFASLIVPGMVSATFVATTSPTPPSQGTAGSGSTTTDIDLRNVSGAAAPTSLSSGNISLPPCLRTAEAARDANVSCVQQAIGYYTNILIMAIGLGAFIYFLYGAFLYATAFGEEKKTTQGKDTIKNALLGIIIASFAFAIVAGLRQVLGVT